MLPAFGMSKAVAEDLRQRGVEVLDMGSDPSKLGYAGPIPEYWYLSRKVKKILERFGNFDTVIFTIQGFAIGFREPFAVKSWGYRRSNSCVIHPLALFALNIKAPKCTSNSGILVHG